MSQNSEQGITGIEINLTTRDLILEAQQKLMEIIPVAEKRGIEKYSYDSMIWFVFHDWLKRIEEENKNEKE